MVVACYQKRVGDDHLELEFQAVVNFLMRGLGIIGSSAGAVYALTAEPSRQPQMGLFVQCRASSSGCLLL